MATFEQLRTLIRVIDTHGQQPVPLLGKLVRRPGKETTLWENIRQGKYTGDEQAATDLYGSPAGSKGYAMLKARLWQKLLNHLFFLNLSDQPGNAPRPCEQEARNLLHQARMLIKRGEFDLAEVLLRQALKIAQEFEYTPICVDCLELLRLNYVREIKPDLFYKTQQTLARHLFIAQCEQEAEGLYYTARIELNHSIHSRKKFLLQLSVIVPRLKTLWDQSDSVNVFSLYYLLDMWYYELIGDFTSIIEKTSTSQQLLKQKKINTKRFDINQNGYMSVYAHFRAKRFADGLRLAKEYLPSFNQASTNWFAFMENYFLLAMHSGDYGQAFDLIKRVDQNDFFLKLSPRAKERWTLYRAYLAIALPRAASVESASGVALWSAVPEYIKDKEGFNVALLILQFLREIQTGDIQLLNSRVESVGKYVSRHVSDRPARRSRLLLRLLVLAVNQRLHADACRKKGAALLAQLKATPEPGDAYAEIEIIPYEHLWELVLREMEAQPHTLVPHHYT